MVPLLLFVLALLLWEVVAVIVMNGSLSLDPLLIMEFFFYGLYALPIVIYVAIAHAVSQQFNGQAVPLLAFAGLCCVGSIGLIAFFMKFTTDQAHIRDNGFVAFIAYPTLCVFALYLGRSILQQPTR